MIDVEEVNKEHTKRESRLWQKAMKAFKNAKQIEPEMAALVRTIAPGQDIKFQWGKASATDGETIFIVPPIAFADLPEHGNIRDCQIIDPETMKHVCPGCELRDDLMFLVLHECAHIVHGSFGEKGWPRRTSQLRKPPKDPHLFIMMNALEDSRVNARTVNDRPGTQRLFQMSLASYIRDGYIDADGKPVTYQDLDDDFQVLIGLHIISSQFQLDWKEFSRPRVAEVLLRRDIHEIALAVIDFANVAEIKKASRKLLKLLRAEGFFLIEEEPDQGKGQPGKGQPGKGQQEQGQPGKGQQGQQEQGQQEQGQQEQGQQEQGQQEQGQQEQGQQEQGQQEQGQQEQTPFEKAKEMEKLFDQFGGHDEETTDSSEVQHEIEQVMSLSDAMDVPSRRFRFQKILFSDLEPETFQQMHSNARKNLGGFTRSNPRNVDIEAAKIEGTDLALNARHVFAANRKVAWSKPDRTGHVRRSTGRRLVSQNRNALFRRQRNDKRSYSVLILADLSRSTSVLMRGGGTRKNAILTAGYASGEMLESLHIDWGFYGFGEIPLTTSNRTEDRAATVVEYKSFDERWDSVQSRVACTGYLGNNRDGSILEWARRQMEKRSETDRIILYFTDGAVPKHGNQRKLFEKNIVICKQNPRLLLLAVPVCLGSTMEEWGVDFEPINDVGDIVNVVNRLGQIIAQ